MGAIKPNTFTSTTPDQVTELRYVLFTTVLDQNRKSIGSHDDANKPATVIPNMHLDSRWKPWRKATQNTKLDVDIFFFIL